MMTGVPMALGHLYPRVPGGVSAGMEVGRGTAPRAKDTAATLGQRDHAHTRHHRT
jgi:hypothetical protein